MKKYYSQKDKNFRLIEQQTVEVYHKKMTDYKEDENFKLIKNYCRIEIKLGGK